MLYLLFPYLALVFVKLLLAAPLNGPIKIDETVYLGNARQLATGSGLVDDSGRVPYKIGYSLMLIPAFFFTDDPADGFKAVQVTNAFLLSLVYPLAFVLAGRLRPDLDVVDRLLAAACVSLYPAALLYATTAMSANAFLPAFFLLVLLAHRALKEGEVWSWAALGATAAYLYMVHERAMGIVGVTVVTALLSMLFPARGRWRPLALLASLPATIFLIRGLEVPGSSWPTRSAGSEIIESAVSDLGSLMVTFAGQLWYLGLSSFGILFLGSLVLALRRGQLAPSGDNAQTPWLFWFHLYGCAAGMFAVSVLFMSQREDPRFTHWIYGRYNEGVLLPLLLVAVIALRSNTSRRILLIAFGAAAAVFGGLTLALKAAWVPAMGKPFSFSASSVPIFASLGGWGIVRAAALMALGFVLLTALFRRRWRWGAAVLAIVLSASTTVSYFGTWGQRYRWTEQQREVLQLVERIAPQPPVVLRDQHSPFQIYHFHYYNLTYFLPDYSFHPFHPRWRSGHEEGLQGDLVLSGNVELSQRSRRARLVGLENFTGRRPSYRFGLWVLPGALQKRLADRGWLMPRGFPKPLSESWLQSGLVWLEEPPKRVASDAGTTLEVELSHRGEGPWPHRRGLGSAEYSVCLLTRWLSPGSETLVARRRWDLPRMLYPGDVVRMELELGPDRLPAPGRYRVVVTTAQKVDRTPVVGDGDQLIWDVEIGE